MSAPPTFQVTGCNSFWKIHCFHFPIEKPKLPNLTSSFEQTMMGWSPQCYIPSFVEISQPVPEKKIFEGFLPYMGMAAILVMWPASCHQIFISLYMYLKAFIQNLVQILTVVSEKIRFEFLYVQDLGPRSRNDLDLQYSHIFIYSIRWLLLLTFRSLAAIVPEKSTVFTFL